MLKGIPSIISPDLMKVLMEMGHGDEIVFADRNFPASSTAKKLIRCDGHGIPAVLDAVLKYFPLDYAVKHPVALMAVTPGNSYKPVIWDDYSCLVKKYEEHFSEFEFMERYEFYERAKKAYAVVATGEMARFANVVLKKGIVVEE